MEKMQEDEFDNLIFDETPEKCNPHKVVKLYYNGTHSDYGCIKCGMCSSNVEDFKRK